MFVLVWLVVAGVIIGSGVWLEGFGGINVDM